MSPFYNKINYFFIKNKNKSGRSKNGRIILDSRCSNKYNKFLSVNINRSSLVSLGIITSISYINKNSCFIGLVKYSNNCMSYIKMVNGIF